MEKRNRIGRKKEKRGEWCSGKYIRRSRGNDAAPAWRPEKYNLRGGGISFVKMDELLKNKTFAVHAAAATGSVALGTAITYPLDTLKVLIQVWRLSACIAFAPIRLYNGVGWLTLGRTLGLGVRFGVYELLTAFYKDGRADDNVHVSEALMAGFAAGMMECLVSSPFELIKLRTQVASASRVLNSQSIAEKSGVPL
ncbi:hypothetical protein Sango_0515600 [Sesamum angolense]|uniref:Mitochondrial substrate carrier family protein n=1 Tax=Sesamum angolense TaxID=2727404 RepID=A0AAE1X4Q7_9LAMI|nr:hypothetical protein Sango_0515600 [Sesamum angolense]